MNDNEEQESQVHEDQELLTKLVGYFESYEESTRDARELAEKCRDYNDHKQLSEAILSTLRKRKQPPTINNRIRKKMNFLRGLERQGRTDPKAFPRTPQHEDDANAVTDALRFVADNASFDQKRSKFFEDYLVQGTGACEIIVSRDGKREIELPNIAWDRFWYDHHSRELDFSDAKYKGIVIWSDLDDAEAAFPEAADVLESTQIGDNDDTFSDRPVKWTDTKRKRVRICQLYYQHKGVWHLAFYTKAGFLMPPVPSPWLDEDGNPEDGIEAQSAYIDRDGNRFGEPVFMLEQQDSINKRESKMLDLVSRRQTFGNQKSGMNTAKNKAQLHKSDGHIEMNAGAEYGKDFGVIQNSDMAAGQFTLLQEAKAEIDETSVNASLTGSDQGDSGRAILAKQSGGQVEITPLFDGKRSFEMRVYRKIWNRVRQFWTDEKWIRVTDDEKNVKFVGLNRKITVREMLENDPEIKAQYGGIPPEFEGDPRLDQVAGIENQVSEMDVDIIVEDSPDIATVQLEEFEKLGKLAQFGITFKKEVYLQASQLRDKAKLIEMENGGDNPEAQQAAMQEQEQVKALAFERETAEIEEINATSLQKQMDAMKKQSEALENKAQVASM